MTKKDHSFYQQVYDIVRKIPEGKVVSYGQIARLLGVPHGARAVGFAMRYCPDDAPWQRVVMHDGAVTGGRFAEVRRGMLESENIPFLEDGRVDMKLCRWEVDAI